jgi:hypothetical protein
MTIHIRIGVDGFARSLGSALGGWMYATHGWHAARLPGMASPARHAVWLTEYAGHTASLKAAMKV